MNWSERLIKEKYESLGYDIIHIGKPDLILLKDGEIEFVEVKTGKDKIRLHQQEAIDLLVSHGFKARVEIVRQPTIVKRIISEKEQSRIIERYHNDELEVGEIWNLIARAQRYQYLKDFTQLLISFFNEKNTENNTDTFSYS